MRSGTPAKTLLNSDVSACSKFIFLSTITDITVAGLADSAAGILTVYERASSGVVLNLPGGHIETGEVPEQAVVRELREETGLVFKPSYLLGCYSWVNDKRAKRYLRLVYAGSIDQTIGPIDVTDLNIVSQQWLSPDDIKARRADHRYPIVGKSVADYLAGNRVYTESSEAPGADFSLADVESMVEQL